MTKTKGIGVALAAVTLAACVPTKPAATHSASQPTMVLKADLSMSGLYVPDFSGKQVVFTRADRRRIDNSRQHDSFIMRWADSNTSDIARIDRSLIWMADHDDDSYVECSLRGCAPVKGIESITQLGQSEEEEYQSYSDLDCPVSLVNNDYAVKATGRQRTIGGMPAKEYTLKWHTEFRDNAGRSDKNRVEFVFWTTQPDSRMSAAWKVHRAFQQAYLDESQTDRLENLLGKNGYMALAAFSGDVKNTDQEQYSGFTRELAKIKGYPLSIKFEWYQQANACQRVAQPASSQPLQLSADGLQDAALSLVGDFVGKQKDRLLEQWKKEALVRYLYEVKYIKEEPVQDSAFDVPAGYRLVDRQ